MTPLNNSLPTAYDISLGQGLTQEALSNHAAPFLIDYKPTYTYSCQVCQKEITFDHEVVIIPGSSPICSHKCRFRLVYRILMDYRLNDLQELKSLLELDKLETPNKQKLVFELSKVYTRVIESSEKVSKVSKVSNSNSLESVSNFSNFLIYKELEIEHQKLENTTTQLEVLQ